MNLECKRIVISKRSRVGFIYILLGCRESGHVHPEPKRNKKRRLGQKAVDKSRADDSLWIGKSRTNVFVVARQLAILTDSGPLLTVDHVMTPDDPHYGPRE